MMGLLVERRRLAMTGMGPAIAPSEPAGTPLPELIHSISSSCATLLYSPIICTPGIKWELVGGSQKSCVENPNYSATQIILLNTCTERGGLSFVRF